MRQTSRTRNLKSHSKGQDQQKHQGEARRNQEPSGQWEKNNDLNEFEAEPVLQVKQWDEANTTDPGSQKQQKHNQPGTEIIEELQLRQPTTAQSPRDTSTRRPEDIDADTKWIRIFLGADAN